MESQSIFKNESIHQLPELEQSSFLGVQKDYLRVVLINTMLVCVIGFIIMGTLSFFGISLVSKNILVISLFWIVLFIVLNVYFILGFKYRKYQLRNHDISYSSGIFFHKQTTVPFSRIQHVEIVNGPISRYYGLASLSIYTAGNSNKDLAVKGLKAAEAQKIKSFIIQVIDG